IRRCFPCRWRFSWPPGSREIRDGSRKHEITTHFPGFFAMVQHNMKNYEEVCHGFRWQRPEAFNFVRAVIDPLAGDLERPAMWWVDDAGREQRLTFAWFSAASRRLC